MIRLSPFFTDEMKESDLYLPLKRFLESQHYEVKGEVNDCDVLAVRGDEVPVVVELKLTLNLDVVLQAVGRLAADAEGVHRRPCAMSVVAATAAARHQAPQDAGPRARGD